MDDLDDELDLRYHRGLNPDVYYRCPTLESLDGALQNEQEKNAASLIPTEIVTEFVFAVSSTITVSVTQQPNLKSLIQPAKFPQSITVELALCRDVVGKDRLKTQRAIAKCFIDTIQEIDGFKYSERQAWNKDGSDGTRFKYVCIDSLQYHYRKGNIKKEEANKENGSQVQKGKNKAKEGISTYDCGGAIHIKFSTKRDAINVVYKHNPIHRDVESRLITEQIGDSNLPSVSIEDLYGSTSREISQKRKRTKKDQDQFDNAFDDPDLDQSISPDVTKLSPKKSRKNNPTLLTQEMKGISEKKNRRGKQPVSSPKSSNRASAHELLSPPPPAARLTRGKACLRCREKKIKCDEGKPTCNQCRRGLWVCQFQENTPRKRSKNGCINCRQRKRKCSEERPSCAYCLKVDDNCKYEECTKEYT